MDLLSWITAVFVQYGYWVIFFGVMLENAGIPLPGETVLLAAAFFACQGHFNLVIVIAVAAVGAVFADCTSTKSPLANARSVSAAARSSAAPG